MKRCGWFIASLFVFNAQAEDWQANLTPAVPGAFPALRPMQASYRFGWGKIGAASAIFDFSTTKAGLLQLDVQAKSEGMVRSLWRMDSRHLAVAQPATLLPVSSEQTEKYRKQELTTKLAFTPGGVARLRESKPPDKNPPKTKHFKFPGVFDLHSALLFVRSQPLQQDEVVRLVVYPAVDPYLAEVTVQGRETISVGDRTYDAVRLNLKLQRISKKMELQTHKKFKRGTAWLSDDQDRLLLRIVADVAVGTVWTELESVKFVEP